MILPEGLEIQFGWVNRHRYRAGYTVSNTYTERSPHAKSFRLRLVTEGAVDLQLPRADLRLNTGGVVLLPPITSLETRLDHSPPGCNFFCVGFRLLLFGSIDFPWPFERLQPWYPDPGDTAVLAGFMELLLTHAHPPTFAASLVRDGVLRATLGVCWDGLGMNELLEGAHPRIPRWLLFVMQEIRHFPGLSVADLERLVGYSRSQFHHLFLRYVGVPPRVHLQRTRLEIAHHLLATTDMTIIAIAEHLGFANAADFTRFFRRLNGTTPTEYRHTAITAQ